MSLLEPLWMLWIDVPLAVLAGLLWWSVAHMDPVPPLVDIMSHPAVRRPISRSDLANPVGAVTATSAWAPIQAASAWNGGIVVDRRP